MRNPWSTITDFLSQNDQKKSPNILELDIKNDPKAGLKMIFAKTSALGKLLEAKKADQLWYDAGGNHRAENFWEEAYKKGKLGWISKFTEEDLKNIEIAEFHKELCDLDTDPWISLDIISECKESRKSPLGKILVDLGLENTIPRFFSEGLLELEAEDLQHINHNILEDMGINSPKNRILILSKCHKLTSKDKEQAKEEIEI